MTKAHAPASPEEINRAQREGRPEPRSADQAHHDDNLNYERYVDGLRLENVELKEFAEYIANHLLSLSLSLKPGSWGLAALAKYHALSKSNRITSSVPSKIITVTIEGGLVQDVAGVPAGFELRIEDHDGDDTSHPAWDEQKECFVTVYDGGDDA